MSAPPKPDGSTDQELIVQPCDGCDEIVMATATPNENGLLEPEEPFAFIYHPEWVDHEPRPPLKPTERFICKKCLRKRDGLGPKFQ